MDRNANSALAIGTLCQYAAICTALVWPVGAILWVVGAVLNLIGGWSYARARTGAGVMPRWIAGIGYGVGWMLIIHAPLIILVLALLLF